MRIFKISNQVQIYPNQSHFRFPKYNMNDWSISNELYNIPSPSRWPLHFPTLCCTGRCCPVSRGLPFRSAYSPSLPPLSSVSSYVVVGVAINPMEIPPLELVNFLNKNFFIINYSLNGLYEQNGIRNSKIKNSFIITKYLLY